MLCFLVVCCYVSIMVSTIKTYIVFLNMLSWYRSVGISFLSIFFFLRTIKVYLLSSSQTQKFKCNFQMVTRL